MLFTYELGCCLQNLDVAYILSFLKNNYFKNTSAIGASLFQNAQNIMQILNMQHKLV